jgi:K+-transporting ATPase ATPase B chain
VRFGRCQHRPARAVERDGLAIPWSAVLSAIVYSGLIIPTPVPIALRDVGYRPSGASALLCRNLAIYGVGDLIAPSSAAA